MAPSTTPTRRMHAGWTASGACTSGSTARHAGATRAPACGSAATASMTRAKGAPPPGAHRRLRGDRDTRRRAAADPKGRGGFQGNWRVPSGELYAYYGPSDHLSGPRVRAGVLQRWEERALRPLPLVGVSTAGTG